MNKLVSNIKILVTSRAIRVYGYASNIPTQHNCTDAFTLVLQVLNKYVENIQPNTDLGYTVMPGRIKEDIIVKERQGSYVYMFVLRTDGLTASIDHKKKSISFTDANNNLVFTIPSPYMTDARGVRGNEVYYALAELPLGYILTVIADTSWINAPERVFPVRIDPTIEISSDSCLDLDTYTMAGQLVPITGAGQDQAGTRYALFGSVDMQAAWQAMNNSLAEITGCKLYLRPQTAGYYDYEVLSTAGNGFYRSLNNEDYASGYYMVPVWDILQATGQTSFVLTVPTGFVYLYRYVHSIEIEYSLKVPTGIEIDHYPSKTGYLSGQTFSTAGMVVKAYYNDDTMSILNADEYSCVVAGGMTNNSSTPASRIVTVSYTVNGITKTCTFDIMVYKQHHTVFYGNHSMQNMDIHLPEDLTSPVPVVLTIHGGNWTYVDGEERSYYNYMTEHITAVTGARCIHVNMGYRLLNGGASGVIGKAPYECMLDDIQSALQHINGNALNYNVDTSKCALMGYSAGGHLALLYAYKSMNSEDDFTSPIPVRLVISEAGPTDLTVAPLNDSNINALVVNGSRLAASPITYVDGNLSSDLKTLLVYGNGISIPDLAELGDGLIPYSQATSLVTALASNGFAENEDFWMEELSNTNHASFQTAITQYIDTFNEILGEL